MNLKPWAFDGQGISGCGKEVKSGFLWWWYDTQCCYRKFLAAYYSRKTAEEIYTKTTLDELFEQSDVVTLQTPHLKETEGMIILLTR